jgi:hypothetical protein
MNMEKISLETFIKNGSFGKVVKNMDLQLAKSVLPKPDIISGEWYGECVLHYGDIMIEAADNRITGIHIPCYDYFDGGGNLELDAWRFEEVDSPDDMTLLFVEGVLNAEHINFSVQCDDEDETITLHIPQSGVSLEFWANEEYSMGIDPAYNYHLSYIYIE